MDRRRTLPVVIIAAPAVVYGLFPATQGRSGIADMSAAIVYCIAALWLVRRLADLTILHRSETWRYVPRIALSGLAMFALGGLWLLAFVTWIQGYAPGTGRLWILYAGFAVAAAIGVHFALQDGTTDRNTA